MALTHLSHIFDIMFSELEKVLSSIEGKLDFLTKQIHGLKTEVDQLNGHELAIKKDNAQEIKCYSRKEVAEKLGVHVDTITNLINNGELHSIDAGRRILIDRNELLRFINNQKGL